MSGHAGITVYDRSSVLISVEANNHAEQILLESEDSDDVEGIHIQSDPKA